MTTGVALAVGGVPAALAAAASGVIATSFEKVRGRDAARAQKVMERLLKADELPDEFADHLRQCMLREDENVLGALRQLLMAAVEAVSPAALDAMAKIVRLHLRDRCPVWVARGGVRTFAEAIEPELAAMRSFLPHVVSYPSRRPAIFEAAGRGEFGHGELSTVGLFVQAGSAWELRVSDPKAEIGPAPEHHRRLFRLLKLNGLADEVTTPPDGVRSIDCVAIDIAVAGHLAAALTP